MTRRRRAPRSPAAATETELKLRVPPARLRELLASPLLRVSGAARTLRLTATYYDTPDLRLWRSHIALRVRREGGRWLQTVKGAGGVQAGVHSRLELETVLRDAHPDPAALPRDPLTKALRPRKVAEALAPVLRTEILRTVRLLKPAPGVVIEAAIDRGVIRSGRRREAVCELELELKQGPVTALFDLAQQLVATLPLALEHHSKAERGYALYSARTAAPVKASALRLNRAMDAGDAFRVIAAASLAQVQGNVRGLLDSEDPEFLHQMRVGLRRLRSALDLFHEQLGDAVAPHGAGLRTIAAGLGAARDWDVLVTETLPRMTGLPAAAALVAACGPPRLAARTKSKKLIKSNTYDKIMLTLGRWLVLPQATDAAAWREPARIAAARILAARYARVLKRGRHLAQQSPAELHRLRIAIKKLRYAVEFFHDLFQVKEMTVQRDGLARLQDILGFINDAVTVEPLLAAAQDGARKWPVAAAEAVRVWHQQRAAVERDHLITAWRRLRAAPQPWQQALRRARVVDC